MTASTKEFWEKAYQNNIGKLIGTCYRYTRNYQLSEDLAHDAFLKAIDKSGTFERKGKFEAWLRRIVVNHTLQYLRDRKKAPFIRELLEDAAPADLTEENIHPITSMQITTAELMETIDQLPEHHRLVFNLYVLEEFTHPQIAQQLGISEGTSKSHLARARKKLQQLLVQKAGGNKEEREDKKALVLLLAGHADESTDQLFRRSIDDFSISPHHPLGLESIQFSNPVTVGGGPLLKWNAVVITTTAILPLLLSLIVAVSPTQNQEQSASERITTPVSAEKKYTSIPSPAATILPDSVIPKRNTKQQPMKPLDSLALMLVLSSAPVNTVMEKDSIKHEIEKVSDSAVKFSADTVASPSPLTVVSPRQTVQNGSGTFRATELFWSENNNEVYFKGRVRVRFKKQNFHGNGSFTFLGKVYLLMVDGQPAVLGRTLKLADKDYELVTLDEKEATEKYQEKGKYGAVEISRAR